MHQLDVIIHEQKERSGQRGPREIAAEWRETGRRTGSNCDRNRNRTKVHRVEESEREMHLMELLRDGLFSLWRIFVAGETL